MSKMKIDIEVDTSQLDIAINKIKDINKRFSDICVLPIIPKKGCIILSSKINYCDKDIIELEKDYTKKFGCKVIILKPSLKTLTRLDVAA